MKVKPTKVLYLLNSTVFDISNWYNIAPYITNISKNTGLRRIGNKDWLIECAATDINIIDGVIDLKEVYDYACKRYRNYDYNNIIDIKDIKDCAFYIFFPHAFYILPEENIDFEAYAKFWSNYQVLSVEEYMIKSIIE
jgi:hypothetical protein